MFYCLLQIIFIYPLGKALLRNSKKQVEKPIGIDLTDVEFAFNSLKTKDEPEKCGLFGCETFGEQDTILKTFAKNEVRPG